MIIEPNPDGGTHGELESAETESTVIQMPGLKMPLLLKPTSDYIQIDYKPANMAGSLHVPGNANPLEFITAAVIEAGPECKYVKKGDRIVVATKGIHGGNKGITIDDRRAYFTQERLVVAVVIAPQSS